MDEFFEHCKVFVPAALIAMMGSLVKYLRLHRGESFCWGEFVTGMVVAAFAGMIVRMLCLGFCLNEWISTAAVAMAGYGGGRTLDVLLEVFSRRAGGGR